jgi:hypothetical protein
MPKANKIYDIRLKYDATAFFIESPKRVRFYGIPCIRGINRARKEAWWAPDTVVYLSISEIRNVYEFPSLAAALAEYARYERAHRAGQATATIAPTRRCGRKKK